jgi:hypothetical protein
VLSSDEHTQFIIATHSPTIVEYAAFEELFLLRPVELVAAGENQLVQVATDEERLKFLREVFGTTANITALQPIVIVEGVTQQGAKTVSDRKLYRALHAGFDHVTIIPGGGKADCIRLQQLLQGALTVYTDRLQVVALLDRDLSDQAPHDGVHLLPVGMIENLLLDPDAIWEAVQSVVERTDLTTVDDVSAALSRVLDEAQPAEIERRILKALGTRLFRPSSPIAMVPDQAQQFSVELLGHYGAAPVAQRETAAQAEVDRLRTDNRRREFFHGKNVLDQFFAQHLHRAGLPREVFRFEVARHARRRRSVNEFFESFFQEFQGQPLVAEQQRPQ